MPKQKLSNGRKMKGVPYQWEDKNAIRIIEREFPTKEQGTALLVYYAICRVDSDFANVRDDKGIVHLYKLNGSNRKLVLQVSKRAKRGLDTTMKYMQKLRDLGLISYGMWRGSDKFLVKGTYLQIQPVPVHRASQCEGPPMVYIRNNISNRKNTKTKKKFLRIPKGILGASGGCSNQCSDSGLGAKASKQPRKKIIIVPPKKPKRKSPSQGNGLLTKWLSHHDLNGFHKHERTLIDFRTKLFSKKIQPNHKAVKEVIGYWNDFTERIRTNGKKLLSGHDINRDTRTTFLCQLAVTMLTEVRGISVADICKAIDNYGWIMINSHWYAKNKYSFPSFVANSRLWDDCLNDNVKGNKTYVSFSDGPEMGDEKAMLAYEVEKFRREERREPDYDEMVYLKGLIKDRIRWAKEKEEAKKSQEEKNARQNRRTSRKIKHLGEEDLKPKRKSAWRSNRLRYATPLKA